MKRYSPLLLGAILASFSLQAAEPSAAVATETTTDTPTTASAPQSRYVSDNIYTFLHRGPGKQYRIIGSINAGEAVTQLAQSEDGKYIQIRDSKQREGWIIASELQSNESFRTLNDKLQQQVTTLNDKLANIDSVQARELKEKSQRLASSEQQLKTALEQLASQKSELEQLRAENEKLNASLGTRKQEQLFTWMKQGGMIAGAGLLVGLIVPYLPRPRRSRRERWMN